MQVCACECMCIYANTCVCTCECVCVPSVNTCIFRRKPDAPSPAGPPVAAYLHVSAEGGVGTEQDLALLAGAVVHPRQLVREAHRVLAPGVRDQQAAADFRPETAKRQVSLQRYCPAFCFEFSPVRRMQLQITDGKTTRAPNMRTELFHFLLFYLHSEGSDSLARRTGLGNNEGSCPFLGKRV